jgi:tryptophanyl-tRNA synthetase
VFSLYKLFASEDEQADLAARYRAGNFGYGTAKKELLAKINEHFEPMRIRRAELESNMDFVEEVLAKGAEKARAETRRTLQAARKAVGLE